MRDFALIVLVLGSLPICFFNPFFGILMWTWIAYFNPHRFTWGFAYDFPIAAAVAVPTLLGTLFARKINRHFLTREMLLLLLLWAWFAITLFYAMHVPLFAGHIALAKEDFSRISKILLMSVVIILLVISKQRLRLLVLVTALSFALLALRATLFGLRTGGGYHVWGPPDSFLSDNNGFALALNMVLPMFYFMAREERGRLLRWILRLGFACSIFSIVLSYSRGGLLGLAVTLAAISFKSRYKVLSGLLIAMSVLLVITFAPEQWIKRMSTFLTGQLDGSAKQRLVSWGTAWNFARDYPITGGSFRALPDVEIFQRYQPGPLPGGFLSSGPHSIYFQFLSEQGFVGLGLFLALVACAWMTVRGLRRRARDLPSARWMIAYTHMVEVALLGYVVSGAFLGFANFDLLYQVLAMAIILKILYRREVVLLVAAREEKHLPIAVEEAVAS